MLIRDVEVEGRREGGMGHVRAREKVCVTVVREWRTWWRVRSLVMWSVGWTFLSGCGCGCGCGGVVSSLGVGALVSLGVGCRPSGINVLMAPFKEPRELVKASTSPFASPRKSSIS